MSNTFNEFSPATISINVNNLPVVATLFKTTMLSYKYATNCEWYTTLTNAKSVGDIFKTFNITFSLKDKKCFPVVKEVPIYPTYFDVLQAIAPYLNDGELTVKDDFRYYTINCTAGKLSGKKTTPQPEKSPTTTPPVSTPAPSNNAPKKPVRTSNKGNKKPQATAPKKYGKTEVRSDTNIATVQLRADNRYTIEEISKELIRQILNGNGGEYVEVKGDCLFKSITKTA